MGLLDLLLRKGRGVGELKSFNTEHALNSNVIKILKQLDSVDKDTCESRNSKNFKALFSNIKAEYSLLTQVENFVNVRLIRLEYDYKEIVKQLGNFDKHYKDEKKRLDNEEINLIKKLKSGEDILNPQLIRQHIAKAKDDLQRFRLDINNLRINIKQFGNDIRKYSKKRMVTVKKIYKFA